MTVIADESAPAIGRRKVHTRQITCEGFERDDGLIDVVATLTDTKPYTLTLPERIVAANDAIHHMRVTMTVDKELNIIDLLAETLSGPYPVCGDITSSYRQLAGMQIKPGFIKEAKSLFRGTKGCTHITELLSVLATAAYQVVWADPDNYEATQARGQGSPIGSCHAMRIDGDVVKTYFADKISK